jgi:glycosyltransferase involved in cell wall biosynthesis
VTGTERYATEVVREIVRSGRLEGRLTVHVPKDAQVPEWLTTGARVVRHASRGLVFEQILLPLVTTGHLLVNLAGPAPLLKRKQLVTMHDATAMRWPQGFSKQFVAWYWLMYFVLARTASLLLTVSSFSQSELANVLRVPRERYAVAPCGHEHFRDLVAERPELPATFDPGQPFVVCVGTLAPHKNLMVPARAVAEAGWQILIVGASGLSHIFATAEGQLPDKAFRLGRISDAELAWCYDHALALVFPSRYEGFGLPLVEAQSRGCPVVASDAASIPEVAGEAALYFPPDDVAVLLHQLELLNGDNDERSQRAAAGRVNVTNFRWRTAAMKVADLAARAL